MASLQKIKEITTLQKQKKLGIVSKLEDLLFGSGEEIRRGFAMWSGGGWWWASELFAVLPPGAGPAIGLQDRASLGGLAWLQSGWENWSSQAPSSIFDLGNWSSRFFLLTLLQTHKIHRKYSLFNLTLGNSWIDFHPFGLQFILKFEAKFGNRKVYYAPPRRKYFLLKFAILVRNNNRRGRWIVYFPGP